MTLTLAWVRVIPGHQELVIASDSRLRAGYAWDAAPKLLPLPRGDAVLAFAGATDFAYPLMLQATNAVLAWDKAFNRGQSLEEVKGHLLRVMNDMLRQISDLPAAAKELAPDALFLLAGFSWRSQTFRIWTLHFDRSIDRFTFRPASAWRGGHDRKVLGVVGDHVDAMKARLVELLRERRKLSTGSFDWEPLEILAEFIRNGRYRTIGGYPQVAKVYQALKVVPFCVRWTENDGDSVATLFGRRLLDYERSDRFPMLELPFL